MIKTAQSAIKIQNIVATFSLSPSSLDLKKIHYAFKEQSVWDKAVFNYGVVVLKVKEPKMSFLIYRTGKIICCGAKSIKDAQKSAKYLVTRLKKAGFSVKKKTEAKIQNIVATIDTSTEVDMEKFLQNIGKLKGVHIIYEPEQFPAAIIKLLVAQDSKATMLLFSTGKMICVGLKDYESIRAAVDFIVSRLKTHH